MSGSFHRLGGFLMVAMAMAVAASIGKADGPSAPRKSTSPNWDHIRVLGGRLGIPRTMTVGAPPSRSVAIADFDGDGNADIAIGAGAEAEVFVLRGDGSGRFGSAVRAARTDWTTVNAVTAVDGIGYGAESSVVSSTTTVRQATKVASDIAADAGTHRAVVADFNGDGTVDVAAASDGSPGLVVYLGRHAGGSNPGNRIALGEAAVALASGDFDGDDAIDLVVADARSSPVTLLFGDGGGGFSRRRSIDVGIRAAADGLAVSDLDADGLADLVVVGEQAGEASVFLGAQGGSFALLGVVPVDSSTSFVSADAGDYEGIVSLTLQPSTIAGGSGATSTGTVTLNAPAPAGGVLVTIQSSNPELAASVPSITVPAGASTASFTIGTNRNYRRYSGLAFSVTISATHGTTTRSAILSVTAQPRPGPLSSFDVHNQGQMCFGVGVRQTQTGYTPEFGSAGNLFDCVPPPNPVGQDGTCTFRQECSLGCERRPPVDGFKFRDVCATTGPFPVAVNPKLLAGGNPSVATLRLNAPAPANSSGVLSSFTVLANTFPNISTPIPQGASSANADVLTARVNSPQFAPIDGSYYTPRADGGVGGRLGLTWLVLVSGTAPPFRLTSLNFDPPSLTSVQGGTALFIFAQMNQVAPDPVIATPTVTVSSSNPAVASIPQPQKTVTQGSSNAGVAIQTHAVSTDTVVTISATLGSTTLTKQLTVRTTPPATRVNSFFLDPFDVPGGTPSTGTVVLDGAAPSGGAVVSLVSSNTAVATMPPNVTVPAGSDRVSFTISTSPVASDTTVTLNANYNGGWAATSLIVTASPGAPTLSSVAVSPASVTGGNGSTGTVTLSAAATGSGAVVNLSRSGSAATVPATVTVPAGSQSATFGITTSAVSTSMAVTITATFAGASRSATLTVTPATPPSGTTATLTVTATGRSGERVTSSPAGINVAVGSTGSASFTTGTQITLSVSNGRDAIWSGGCSSGGNKTKTCALTVNANTSVTANVQ